MNEIVISRKEIIALFMCVASLFLSAALFMMKEEVTP